MDKKIEDELYRDAGDLVDGYWEELIDGIGYLNKRPVLRRTRREVLASLVETLREAQAREKTPVEALGGTVYDFIDNLIEAMEDNSRLTFFISLGQNIVLTSLVSLILIGILNLFKFSKLASIKPGYVCFELENFLRTMLVILSMDFLQRTMGKKTWPRKIVGFIGFVFLVFIGSLLVLSFMASLSIYRDYYLIKWSSYLIALAINLILLLIINRYLNK